MKLLVAEDDFFARKMLIDLLQPHGDVDIAVNGLEALQAFKEALDAHEPYHLVCLDIMMPKMDGQVTLKKIRLLEEQAALHPQQFCKIFMTTALSDRDSVFKAALAHCDAYLIKPINKAKLESELLAHGLIPAP
jgi:two-component system chemotaxis response regulator CheY